MVKCQVLLYLCNDLCSNFQWKASGSSIRSRKDKMMADRTGQRLGNYQLTRLIGRGGFAEVYLGEHVRLSTQAAIKILYTRLTESDEVEYFQREARTIAHLEHPHIVRVLDFDVQESIPFLIMG